MRGVYDYLVKLGLLVPLEKVKSRERRIKEQQRKGFAAERETELVLWERSTSKLRANYKKFWNEQ